MNQGLAILAMFLLVLVGALSLPAGGQSPSLPHRVELSLGQENVTFHSGPYALYGEIYYPENASGLLPAVVACEGTGGYVSAYSWIAKAIASDGYVAFLFDFPGQGKSEGLHPLRSLFFPRLNVLLRPGVVHESIIHYTNGDCTQATRDAISYLTEESPVAAVIDETCIGLIGHSLGGLVVTDTACQDSRVKAVVALSHATPESVQNLSVPVQLQGGALELSPFSKSVSILETCYKDAPAPKEVVFIAGGTHLGFTTTLGRLCPCPPWQKACCLRYALGWFDWFLKGDSHAYALITFGDPGISRVLRSRYDFGEGDCFLHP